MQDIPAMITSVYRAYPRKVAKRYGETAIRMAVKRLIKEKRHATDAEALDWLKGRVEKYAEAVKLWSPSDRAYIPHPSTWFNQDRFDDDEAEWRRGAPKPAVPRMAGPPPDVV